MNSDKVKLLDEAIDNLKVGSIFYDSQQVGVGSYFLNSLLSDISSLEIYSGIHPVRFDYFRMLSKRFPFAVYYEIVSDVSRVVAVLDMRRDPKSIRKILELRKTQQDGEGNSENPAAVTSSAGQKDAPST